MTPEGHLLLPKDIRLTANERETLERRATKVLKEHGVLDKVSATFRKLKFSARRGRPGVRRGAHLQGDEVLHRS